MIFHFSSQSVAVTRETNGTVFDAVLALKHPAARVHAPCGGHGSCRKCTVAVTTNQPTTEPADPALLKAFRVPEELHPRTSIRFACQTPLTGDITDVFLPDSEDIRGADSGDRLFDSDVPVMPLVLPFFVTLTRPTVDNPIDVYTNLYRALFEGDCSPESFGYPADRYTVLRTLCDDAVDLTAELLTKTEGDVSLTVAVTCSPQKGSILSLTAAAVLSVENDYPYQPLTPTLLAVDLGTTTVALSLWNPADGSRLTEQVLTNPQRGYGADVISRMSYAADHGTHELCGLIRETVKNAVLHMVSELFPSVSPEEALNNILFVSIAGNSVMEHLFMNRPTTSISKAPFYMTEAFGCAYPAHAILSDPFCHKNAAVYLAPLTASYIGGDITAGLAYLAEAYPASKSHRSLFLDLGTNGEICLISPAESPAYLLAATAAGPALEGAHIKMGMSAITGAISHVELSRDHSDDLALSVIGEQDAAGLCGSGLISAIASFLDAGLITATGRICDDGEAEEEEYEELYERYQGRIRENDDGTCQINLTDTVFLHESDIRQVQTAKAAIAAGCSTLLELSSLKPSDLDALYLAGSFGGGIHKHSGCRMGLLPVMDESKIVTVGNTSAKGAAAFMLYAGVREALENILSGSRYTELSGSHRFTELFVDNMLFE